MLPANRKRDMRMSKFTIQINDEKDNKLITSSSIYSRAFIICGQTYTRKLDAEVVSVLASFGGSIHKVN